MGVRDDNLGTPEFLSDSIELKNVCRNCSLEKIHSIQYAVKRNSNDVLRKDRHLPALAMILLANV